VCIPSGKCSSVWWWMEAPIYTVMHHMTIIAPDLMEHFMEYVLNEILTWGSHSRCLSEIWHFDNPSLPVWSLFSVVSVKIDTTRLSNINFLCELTIVIPCLPCLFSMAKVGWLTIEPVNSVSSNSVNLFNFTMIPFACKCFPIEQVQCSDWCQRS